MRIALYGGSFDPVHKGHLSIAQLALERGYDQVWWIPCASSPLKQRTLTPAIHRVNMLRLVLADEPRFKLYLGEIHRMGPSYTIDTVRLIQAKHDDEFAWILGQDQFDQFAAWKEADTLKQLVHLEVFSRQPVPCSSSAIRQGNQLNYLDERVLAYLYQHHLYLENFLQARLTWPRYEHCVSVAQTAVLLAQCHGIDTHLAYLAGLFHDICKSMPKVEMEKWLLALEPDRLSLPVPVWHGFVGSWVARRIFKLPESVCQAIYHHVLGDGTDDLSRIVYLSDKLEGLRDYDTSKALDLSKQDLEAGVRLVLEQSKAYRERKKA